jgi:hypothetical protein
VTMPRSYNTNQGGRHPFQLRLPLVLTATEPPVFAAPEAARVEATRQQRTTAAAPSTFVTTSRPRSLVPGQAGMPFGKGAK